MLRFALLALLALSACSARTAYTADGRTFTCVQQTRPVTFPTEPLKVSESK
jgi:hypothetical protein